MKRTKQNCTVVVSVTMPKIVATVQSVVARTERSIRDDLKSLGIQPLGKRQRPQRYEASAPWRVLASLGYPVAADKFPPTDTALSALNTITKETKRQKETRIAKVFGIKYGKATR